jgi:hypothetical protein
MTSKTRIHRTLGFAIGVGVLALPASAPAMPISDFAGASGQLERTPARVTTIDDGFDWGDAALGAGTSALVLTLLGAGGIAVGRRHRMPLAS